MLVVDATQGVEAQTVANAMMAMNANLEIIPLINKIDLPSAEPERVKAEIEDGLGHSRPTTRCWQAVKPAWAFMTCSRPWSTTSPRRRATRMRRLRALIFDSYFDPYRGVVALVRVVDGSMRKGQKLKLMASGNEYLGRRGGRASSCRGRRCPSLAWAR